VYIAIEKLLRKIPDDAKVMDLGGWNNIFPRANVVVDLLPYETRHNFTPEIPERFDRDHWIIADFCGYDFWKTIPDKAFDFITISHTLEDIRDPLYVCSQIIRCARAGYIEAPSKFLECSKPAGDALYSGFDHHRWIIEPMPDLAGLIFKAKLSWAHAGDYLGNDRRKLRMDYFHTFDGYFWSGSFRYVEHFQKGTVNEMADLEWYFKYVVREVHRNNILTLIPNSTSTADGRCLWVDEYELPSQYYARTGRMPLMYPQYLTTQTG
jgi:hypothetical protein